MNTAIHRAVRRDLQRFIAALGSFRDGDTDRAAGLGRAWDNFDDQLTHHHSGEHEIAWPALQSLGVSTELLTQFDAEHEAMAASLGDARAAITRLRSTAKAADADAAREAFEKLQTVTISHLDHEEAEFEPVYLAHRDGPELKAMGKAFAKVSPSRGGRFFAWVSDGATPEEMDAITADIPGPVLRVLSGIFGHGYRRDVAPVWRS